jgi:hypothetical protein
MQQSDAKQSSCCYALVSNDEESHGYIRCARLLH